MYGIALKNDRGISISNGQRVYFIDRRQKTEVHEGIVNYNVTVEKDGYGFCNATNICNTNNLKELIAENKVKLDGKVIELNNETLIIDEYNTYDAKISFYRNMIKYTIKLDGKFVWDAVTALFNKGNKISKETMIKVSAQMGKELLYDLPKKEHLYELIINNINSLTREIYVGNKTVKIKSDYSEVVYYYDRFEDKLVGIDKVSDTYINISNDILNFILNHRICLDISYSDDGSIVVEKKVTVLNQTITIKMLNNRRFSLSIYKAKEKELVENARQVEEFRKYIGKYINRSNISELSKLNIKAIQLGR